MRLSESCLVGGTRAKTADELTQSRAEVSNSPRVQRRIPDRVEVRENDTNVDEITRYWTVWTEEEQRVDSVERQPGDDEDGHDDTDSLDGPCLAGHGRHDSRGAGTVPCRPDQRVAFLHNGTHRHHLYRHCMNLHTQLIALNV